MSIYDFYVIEFKGWDLKGNLWFPLITLVSLKMYVVKCQSMIFMYGAREAGSIT
jgi:hypothetical protein